MTEKPKKNSGIIRILYAFTYTFSGLRHAILNEAAFRQEALLFVVALIAIFFMPVSGIMKLLLLISSMIILIVELLNCAIEAIVDKASPEYNELAKQAKDMGSAAVFLSFTAAGAVWIYAIIQIFLDY
jgi:diacylglycerol kinase (ATP)